MHQPSRLVFGSSPPKIVKSPDDLGKVLFERRPSLNALCIVSAIFLAAGVGLGIAAYQNVEMLFKVFLGIASSCCLLCCPAIMHTGYATFFRCHEHGVSGKTQGKPLSAIGFGEIDRFTWNGVEVRVNFCFNHFEFGMRFEPFARLEKSSFGYGVTTGKRGDPQLEAMRDHVCELIAARLRAELADKGSVVWTPTLTLKTSGLEFDSKSLGKQVLSFQYVQHGFEDGVCSIVDNRTQKEVAKTYTKEPNFFPGLIVFEELCGKGTDTTDSRWAGTVKDD